MRVVMAPLLMALLAGPAAGAGPDQAFILGGGKTRADAEAWLARWNEVAPHLAGFLKMPAGYPKIVESATVAGLNPGFHIVLLGFCDEAAVRERFELLMLHAGVYTKTVAAPVANACPALEQGVSVVESVTVKRKDRRHLEALHVSTAKGPVVLVLAFDAEQRLLGAERLTYGPESVEGFPQRCEASLAKKGDRARAEVSCELETPGCGDRVKAFTRRLDLTLGDDRPIAREEKTLDERREGWCD